MREFPDSRHMRRKHTGNRPLTFPKRFAEAFLELFGNTKYKVAVAVLQPPKLRPGPTQFAEGPGLSRYRQPMADSRVGR
jgi:hypothetical protein